MGVRGETMNKWRRKARMWRKRWRRECGVAQKWQNWGENREAERDVALRREEEYRVWGCDLVKEKDALRDQVRELMDHIAVLEESNKTAVDDCRVLRAWEKRVREEAKRYRNSKYFHVTELLQAIEGDTYKAFAKLGLAVQGANDAE
jgi:hypothetical protein